MAASMNVEKGDTKRTGDDAFVKISDQQEEHSAKKAKISEEKIFESSRKLALESFEGFKVTKIISENAQNKTVFLHGKFEGSDDIAVVLLEKTALQEQAVSAFLTEETKLVLNLQNDIYSVYEGLPTKKSSFVKYNGIKTTVIYPATERHISKYTKQEMSLVEETWADYCNITLPYLQAEAFKIQWVYNILEKTADEVKYMVYEDPDPQNGFVLIPDMKWDRKQMENLYLVAIFHRRNIKSLRDLDASHIPLLRNVRDKCQKVISETYSIAPDQLRVYLHYQPSYYHLHIHFNHLKFDAPGSGVTNAHLLSDVIENIELMSDYYQRKTLSFVLSGNSGLLAKFRNIKVTSI